MKDKDEAHFTLPFLVGGCDREFLLKCLQDYQTVASFRVNKEGQLQPDTFMRAVTMFTNKHLSPLDVHPIQAIRLMLLEGYYQLGERWCKPGASRTSVHTNFALVLCLALPFLFCGVPVSSVMLFVLLLPRCVTLVINCSPLVAHILIL